MIAFEPSATAAAGPYRVGLLSARFADPGEWRKRGLVPFTIRAAGMDVVFASPPHVLVVDQAALDEVTAAEAWRAHDLLGIPIIVVATSAESDDVVGLLHRGADDVIVETPTVALIAARVNALLRRLPSSSGPELGRPLHLGSVEVDMEARTVHSARGTQELSRGEFNLLLALLRGGGRTCTQTELTTAVWGTTTNVSPQNLRIYVSRLRQKLDDDPVHPAIILNHWGIGYSLVLPTAAGPFRLTSARDEGGATQGDNQQRAG